MTGAFLNSVKPPSTIKIKYARKTLFKTIVIVSGREIELNSTETKGWRVFKSWEGGGWRNYWSCVLALQKKYKISPIPLVMIIGSLKKKKTWSNVLTRTRFLPSHRVWEIGVLSISMFTFQRDGSPVLEEDIPWIVKLAKDW